MNNLEIKCITISTPQLAAGISRLLPLLTTHPQPFDETTLAALISHPGVYVFVALEGDNVAGVVQLSSYPRAYRPAVWVDGMIVDEAYRGHGLAKRLTQAAIDKATELGWHEINLTSSPKREAANHVYSSLGFERYDTNFWKYVVDLPTS